MSTEQTPPDADLDEMNARLSDSLKTCRSVVANYKALLKDDQVGAEPLAGMPLDNGITRESKVE